MNQLTTIAALPSGAGQAAHLKPEIGHAATRDAAQTAAYPAFLESRMFSKSEIASLGREAFNFCDECETCSTCLKTGCLPVIDPDMLDAAG